VFNGTVWQKVDGGSTGLLSTLTVTGNTFLATTSGDVGIGTSSPVTKLDVAGTARIQSNFFVYGSGDRLNVFPQAAGSGVQLLATNNANSAYAQLSLDGSLQIFNTNGSERMRITATGDVGIGTSSPATKLHVNTVAAGYGITVAASTQTSITYQLGIDSNSNLAVYDTNAAAQRLVLSASGNLGLGVTPSAWNSTSKALQISTFVSVSQQADGAANFGFNFYEDAANTFKYSTTDEACRFSALTNGGFGFFTAPSGTAGNTISFTQAMTLDVSGDLVIGSTTTNGIRLTAEKNNPTRGIIAHLYNIASSGQTGSQLLFTQNGVANFVIGQPAGVNAFALWGGRNTAADGTEFMRVDASGNLLVGSTSGAARIISAVPDGTYSFGAVGTTKAIRISHSSTASKIEGVDSTLSASYQPLALNGSYFSFETGGTERARIPAAGGMVVGTAALATNATDGFLYVPTCAGTPTGTPTTQTGTAPIVIDTTNNKLYFYSGGQWRDAGP
jgi:hypothetical protein